MVTLKGEAKQQYVAELFSGIARRYDLMNDLMTCGQHRRWKNRSARLAAGGIEPGSRGLALDVATGTGDIALRLGRQQGVEGVVGVDLLPEMVGLASSKAKPTVREGGPEFALGDAFNLPFRDSTFGCCTAGFSLRNMPSTNGTDGILRALGEMARVVRPGGRVVTLELTPMEDTPLSRLIRWYFHRIVPVLGQAVAGNRSAYTYLPQSVDYFPDALRLQGLFEDVSLGPVGFETWGFGAVAIHWGVKAVRPGMMRQGGKQLGFSQ